MDHELLTTKIEAYGFGPEVISWIRSFLSYRTQQVVIGRAFSEWRDVLSSVPQSSVLGPLLFLIFINDMPELVNHFCKLFADDTMLIAIIRDTINRELFQKNIDALVTWSNTWKMCFNEDKCKVMYFERGKRDALNKLSIRL